MPALREFANFIILNMANLAETYAQLLAESGRGYEAFPAEQCTASGRRLLRAVIEAYESETAGPLCRLFDGYAHEGPRRWAKDIDPPHPLIEVECLGQTLVPVVTNLEASKFLWQILSEVRATVLQSMEKSPPIPAGAPAIPVAPPIAPRDGVQKVESPDRAVDRLQFDDTSIQEHNLLRTLINNMPDYIYVKDTESRFIIGNAATARVMGAKTPDELVGKTDLDFYPEDLAAQYYADEQAIIRSGRSLIDHEEPIVDPNGNEIWISTTKVPLRNSQGKIVGVVGIGRDITERKRLEQQLHQSLERRTRQVQTSIEVTQEIAAAPALDDLFWRVVNLVQERFGYSHVNLYMLEENDLVMQESTSDVGSQMKEAVHKIALSAEQSLIARVARSGEPILVPDVSQGPAWLPHPLLPRTKAELAVPIKLGDKVLGVLNVENDAVGSLDEEDQLSLLGFCGQIAIAINTRQAEAARKRIEEELQVSEARIRDLLISTEEAVMLLDEKGFTDCNEATLRVFGYSSKDQFINTHPSEQSPPQQPDGQDSWTAVNERIATAYRTGSHRFEWLHRRADGALFPAEVLLTALTLEGKPILQAVVRDISEYKEAQAALDEERNLLRSLIDNVPDRIYAKDTQSRFIICNVATARRLGKTSPDEIVGKSDFDFVPPELAERFYADEQAIIQSGQPVINREEPLAIGEDGQVVRWNLATKVPLRDNQGNIIGIVGLGREITELKRTEEALAQEQYLLHILLDSVPDRIYFKDTDSRFLRISKSQAEMFGLSAPEQAMGKTDFDFFTEEHARPAFEDEQRIIRTGQPVVDLEERETWPDGHEAWVLTTKMPLHDKEGRIVGTFGISRDITERKLSEQIVVKRATQLETVTQVSTATSTILDTQELLQTVVDLTKERFNLYHAHIYLLNQTGDMLNLAAGAGQVGRQMVAQGWHIPLIQVQSLVARAARTRQSVVVNNVREDPDWLSNPLLPDTHSELAAPLLVGDRILGVLDVQADEVGYFTDEDVRIQTTLAAQIAIAIHNATLFESVAKAQKEAEDRLQETQILQQLAQTLSGTLQVDEVIGAFFQACTSLLKADFAAFSLVDQERQRVKAVAGFNVTDEHIRRANHPLDSDDIMADVIRTGQTEIIKGWDPRFDPVNFETERMDEWGVRIFAPITLRQENVGLIEVGFKKNVGAEVQDTQVRLLNILIDQTAIALESARRYEASQRAARREQTIRQITEKMRAATSLAELAKMAAEELGERLSAGHAVVKLGIEADRHETDQSHLGNGNEQDI